MSVVTTLLRVCGHIYLNLYAWDCTFLAPRQYHVFICIVKTIQHLGTRATQNMYVSRRLRILDIDSVFILEKEKAVLRGKEMLNVYASVTTCWHYTPF